MADPLRFIAGGVLIGAGILIGTLSGGLASNVSLALISLGAGLVMQGVFGTPGFQDGIQSNITSTQAPLSVIYGRAKVGHVTVDTRTNATSADSDNNKLLYILGALGIASENGQGIEGIERIYLNGRLAILDPTFPTNTVGMAHTGVMRKYVPNDSIWGGGNFLEYNTHAGVDAPAIDAAMWAQFGPVVWKAEALGAGVAYVTLKLKWDDSDEDRVYESGVPSPIQYIVRGNRVYDPRFITDGPDGDGYCWDAADSDVSLQKGDGTGGTNGYADLHPGMNPALCLYDYLKSIRYGVGIDVSRLDTASFISLANHCDEDITLTGVSGSPHQARYQMNGALSTATDHKTNIEKILSSCNANLIWQSGQISVQARKSQTAETFELTADNIVGQISMVRSGSSIPNTVTAKFVDADNEWSTMDVVWPEPGTNNYLTADAGQESELQLEFPLTTNYHMAQHLAMVALKELREDVAIEVTATEESLALLTGDVVKVTYDSAGFAAKEFRVAALTIREDSMVDVKLREYDTTVYNLDTQSDAPTVPGTDLPNPGTVLPPTNLVLLSDSTTVVQTADGTVLPSVKATWTKSVDRFLDYEDISYRTNSDPTDLLNVTPENVTTLPGYSFSRTGNATYFDAAGILQTATTGVIRDNNWSNGIRSIRTEEASTNLVVQSSNLSLWSTSGTPVLTGSQSDPAGGTAAYLVGDDSFTTEEYIHITPTFTGNAVKAVSVFLKAGTSLTTLVKLVDTTASVDRLEAEILWLGNEPDFVNVITGSFLEQQKLPDGWYRFSFATTTVTAANTNNIRIMPAGYSTVAWVGYIYTGDISVFGVQAEDMVHSSSYIATSGSTVTRNADVLSVDFSTTPEEMTVYSSGRERSGVEDGSRVWDIGGTTSGFMATRTNGYMVQHFDNATNSASQTGGATIADLGDLLEIRGILAANGSARIGASVNGSPETLIAAGIANAFGGSWGNTTLNIGQGQGAAFPGFFDFESIRVAPGTVAMADMRGDWIPLGRAKPTDVNPDTGLQEIRSPPVVEGAIVGIRVRAINTIGAGSPAIQDSVAATGKSSAPADVTAVAVSLSPAGVYRMSWNNVADTDLSHYEVRYGASWAAGTVLVDRYDTNTFAFLASDIGAAARSTTMRVKAFDRSGNESVNDGTVALADPAPVAVAPTSVLSRNGIITVTVNTTTTEATSMRLYASTSTSFTPGDANRYATVQIPEDGLGAQTIAFALPLAMIGVTVYMRLGFVDMLTVPLAESETLNTEFNDTGVDPADTVGGVPTALIDITNPGEITLTVQDDDGFLTGIGFKKYFGGAWEGSWTDDTIVPFLAVASVTIEEKRDTAIAWRLIYDAGSGTRYSGGVATFDADTAPEVSFLTLDVTDAGATETRFGVDDDCLSVRYSTSTGGYPTAVTTRGETPKDMTGIRTFFFDSGSITEGQTRYVTMFAYSDTAGLNDESPILYQVKVTRPSDTTVPNTDTHIPSALAVISGGNTITLTVQDDDGYLTGIGFQKYESGAYQSWVDDTSVPYLDTATVTLVEGKQVAIHWRLLYDIGGGTEYVTGTVVFDPDYIPRIIQANLSTDHATGDVFFDYSGDDDTLGLRYVVNFSPSTYPTRGDVDAGAPEGTIITGRSAVGELVASGLPEGDTAFISFLGYDNALCRTTDKESVALMTAQATRHVDTTIPNTDTQTPTLRVLKVVSAGSTTTTLEPSDGATPATGPGDFTTPFRFRHSTPELGPGTWSIWADENTAPYDHITPILEKHNLVVQWEATYDLGLGAGAQIITDFVTYDKDTVPSLIHVNIDQDAGVPTVTWGGDDDAERVRWAEATDAAFPSKATAESGTIETARSFPVGSITAGQTKRVTVVAERTTAPAGFGGVEYQVEVTMPPDTDTVPTSPGGVDLMVVNGDFEDAINGAYWCDAAAGFTGTVEINTTTPLAGTNDLKITSSTGATDCDVPASISTLGFVTNTSANRRWIPVQQGDNFLIHGTFKGQADHPIRLMVEEVDAAKGSPANATIISHQSASALTYREAYTVGSGATYVNFYISVDTDTSARAYYADDIQIRRWFSNTSGIPIIGGMAVGATLRLGDNTLPKLNFNNTGAWDGRINWGDTAWQIVHPNGSKFTVSADQDTNISRTTPSSAITATATFAYVGQDETRFTSGLNAELREIVRVRSTDVGGWEYYKYTGSPVWASFTPDPDDVIIGMADIDLVTDPGDVISVGIIGVDGATVIEAEDGSIPAGTGADDGAGARTLPKGMNVGQCAHNDAVTFTDSYNSAPTVIYSTGGATMEQRAKWGNKSDVDDATAGTAAPTEVIYQSALFEVDVAGFTAKLYLRNNAALTARSVDLAEDTSITTQPTYTGIADMSTANSPAWDDQYKCAYDITIGSNKQGVKTCTVTMEGRAQGGTFAEIASVTAQDTFGIGGGTLLDSGDLTGVISGFLTTGTDEIRCRVKEVTGAGITTIAVDFGTGATGGADIRWNTSSSIYANMTPVSGDEITYFVQADVGTA